MQHLQPGTLLQSGKYNIVRHISSGGFGNTYEGLHVLLKKRVAIKEFFVKDFCNRDETTSSVTVGITSKTALVKKLKTKFLDEAQFVSTLKHPNIVNVYDVFEENGTAYYVMDYVDGPSLNGVVKNEGALSEQKALKYILQVAEALKYVHSNNRLHLDVKPGNIMIGKDDVAILIDFGASKQYDEESGENTSTLMGKTPGYAPLEQMGNDVVKFLPSTDIYALGATLYKLLTGITPPSAHLLASGEELSPLPPNVSDNVRKAVLMAMSLNKSKRPQTIDEFVEIINNDDVTVTDNGEKENEVTVVFDDGAGKGEHKPNNDGGKGTTPKEIPVQKPATKEKNNKKTPIIIAACVALLVIGVMLYNYVSSGNSSKASDNIEIEASAYTPDIRTYTANGVNFQVVEVKGGTFNMGATSEQGIDANDDEKPVHKVTLSDYYIGKTEVTQALWQTVMGDNPSIIKGDNLPVANVSWDDCQTFISKLNALTGKNFRLPTEAEWEFAARGGVKSNGYKYSGSNNIDDVAWYSGNSGSATHIVGTKSPNELGIYDMSGNVYEWCSDWYGNYSSSSQTDPKGPNTGSNRVRRGGSWGSLARYCRVSIRYDGSPGYRYGNLGLRLCLSK